MLKSNVNIRQLESPVTVSTRPPRRPDCQTDKQTERLVDGQTD